MREDGKVWFVVSLWEKAIRVTIQRIEHGEDGRILWVESKDRNGNWHCGYPSQFTTAKPVQYGF